ncbi:hypothetical protein B0H19DRAFT_1253697 [Mycena capillaripes]|nr:hypothetical protein B0H19DRAFT_1253697 [Mycena capillaripes]
MKVLQQFAVVACSLALLQTATAAAIPIKRDTAGSVSAFQSIQGAVPSPSFGSAGEPAPSQSIGAILPSFSLPGSIVSAQLSGPTSASIVGSGVAIPTESFSPEPSVSFGAASIDALPSGPVSAEPIASFNPEPSASIGMAEGSAGAAEPSISSGPIVVSGPTISSGPIASFNPEPSASIGVAEGSASAAEPSISSGPIVVSGPTISSGPVASFNPEPSASIGVAEGSASAAEPSISSGPIVVSAPTISSGPIASFNPQASASIGA